MCRSVVCEICHKRGEVDGDFERFFCVVTDDCVVAWRGSFLMPAQEEEQTMQRRLSDCIAGFALALLRSEDTVSH